MLDCYNDACNNPINRNSLIFFSCFTSSSRYMLFFVLLTLIRFLFYFMCWLCCLWTEQPFCFYTHTNSEWINVIHCVELQKLEAFFTLFIIIIIIIITETFFKFYSAFFSNGVVRKQIYFSFRLKCYR